MKSHQNVGTPELFWRPDVVWFGESLSPEILQAAFEAASYCDLLFSGGTVVEVNPEETSLSPCADYVPTGLAGQILPILTQAAWKGQSVS